VGTVVLKHIVLTYRCGVIIGKVFAAPRCAPNDGGIPISCPRTATARAKQQRRCSEWQRPPPIRLLRPGLLSRRQTQRRWRAIPANECQSARRAARRLRQWCRRVATPPVEIPNIPAFANRVIAIVMRSEDDAQRPPACQKCLREMTPLGRLPPIGIRKAVRVYRCLPCQCIATTGD
jgi:hypothetical protein